MTKKSAKYSYNRRFIKFQRLGVFLAGFAVVGGGVMLFKSSAATTYVGAPHHAACVQNTVGGNKTHVRPGEKFTATVKMKNNGTSTFSPSYGFFLDEFNSGVATNYWNASGGSLTTAVAPGGTATFNLGLTAPAQTGTYGMNWAMTIVYNGVVRDPCVGKTMVVANPPVVSLNLNGQPSNIAMTQGTGLTISWSASNAPTSCVASGSWSGAKAAQGSENRSADIGTVGSKTYTLQCSNQVGTSATSKVSRTVTVNALPASPTPSNPNPSPSPTPSQTSQTPSNSTITTTTGGIVPSAPTDTTPPSVPANFHATYGDQVVDLGWDPASDDRGIGGYQLERSLDQTNWQQIGTTITGEFYTDEEVIFQTTYYYRVRSLDTAGNSSAYAMVDVLTGSFEPNVNGNKDLELMSDDGIAKVTIPFGALSQDASCSLRTSQYLYPNVKNYASVSGPYALLCKLAEGSQVSVFEKPVIVQAILNSAQKKQYAGYKYFTYQTDWKEVTDVSKEQSFVLGDATDFAILGKTKKTPLWQKILVGLLLVILIVGGGLALLLFLRRRMMIKRLERQSQDLYNKEHGY